MATTTNYGWTTPDDTALVKDGAAAIRTLASSVDTTTKNLNPSTTLGDIEYRSSSANTNTRLGIGSSGQVLTVAAGVPSWANGFANPLTTTGDTIYSSSGTTPARLAIGTTGQILTVTGGVPVWATPAGGGGMTLLSTTTLSGTSTTVTISDFSYKDLQIIAFGATWSGSGNLAIKPNNSTTLATGHFEYYTDASPVQGGTSSSYIQTGINTNNGTNTAVVTIYNYASETANKPYSVVHGSKDSSNNGQSWSNEGAIMTTSQISSLVFVQNSSASMTGGTVLVYGVK